MSIRRNILTGGLSSVAVMGLAVIPFAPTAGAMSVEDIKKPAKPMVVKTEDGKDIGLKTELDCGSHTLTAEVKNKTDETITPKVRFNDEEQNYDVEIMPDESASYFYNFTGNNQLISVEVAGETFKTVTELPLANCLEPVSFTATEWSDSAVVGKLQNNSTLVGQTAYLQIGDGDVRVEWLDPGESRTVALPFKAYPEQELASMKVATAAGYESSYTVDLEKEVPDFPVPLDVKKKH